MSALEPTRRRWIIPGIAIALVAALGFGIWYFVFRDDAPPAVDLEAATQSVNTDPATSSGGDSSIDGTWTVDTTVGDLSAGTASFVGYRVQEELAGIGAKTAVGRTPAVEGSLTIDGTTVTEVSIVADLTALASDSDRRDGAMQSQAIETARFPDATFALTEPIELESVPAEGESITAEAVGTLTIHGVTRPVTIDLQAQLTEGVIVVTGQLPIVFADYDIDTPTSFAVLSIEDNGVMELQLFFARA
ncbi:MAG TPA: YceI family protein [Acidimicrobiia bacterium]|nr:YceI family protein [Acidimicrobiia bacterium]